MVSGSVAPAARQKAAQPTVVRSLKDRLDVELVLDYALFSIGNDRVRLRTYNGQLVGPTLRAKAGDRLFVTLRNRLPVEPEEKHEANDYHIWNTTNLHYHGLHVAPQGTGKLESDNVLIKLEPIADADGSVQEYEVHIPKEHPAGTFWYHPHVHGSTTPQVASGAAGALIIERDDDVLNLDHNPAIRAAAEEILVLQQIPYLMDRNLRLEMPYLKLEDRGYGEIEKLHYHPTTSGNEHVFTGNLMFDPGSWKKLRRYVTVNGRKIPTIKMAPGEVRRFRFIHAGQRELITLQLQRAAGSQLQDPVEKQIQSGPSTLALNEIAVDGLPTGDMTEKSKLDLYPGYRSDVLIQAPRGFSGEYDLVDLQAPGGTGDDGSPELLSLVARIVIAGDPKPMELPRPADLVRYRRRNLGPPTDPKIQYVNYAIVERQNEVKYFLSDQDVEPWDLPRGEEFDPTKYRELTLGKIQKWIVGSRNGTERDLRVVSPQEAMSITKGEDLIIVASGSGDLRFRIFKYDGEREDVVAPVKGMLQSRCFDPSGKPNPKKDWDEDVTPEKAQQIVGLRKRLEMLEGLGPRHELTRAEKRQVITEVESIAGLTIDVAHPFHIHINSFLVQEVKDEHGEVVTKQEIGKPTWRDTLALKQGYTYTLFMEYEDFSGSFVEHCHILDHEDHGMMEIVTIVDPSKPRQTPPDIVESPGKLPIADPMKPTVALFVKGTDCPHCMSQVKELGTSLDPSRMNLVVVSSAKKTDLAGFPRGPFGLVADPGLRLFRQFGAVKDASNEPLHATIVLNPAGKAALKEIGDAPFQDFAAVRRALAPR